MKQNNTRLFWVLLLALVLCVTIGLMLDPTSEPASTPVGSYHVQITEICAKNETIISDNDGKYHDYIELYNAGDCVDLAGCSLTDGSVRYYFDSLVLGEGEYRVLFLGKETTGFALSASGRDSIQLQDAAGNVLAQAKLRTLNADQVMVYVDGVWQLGNQPSPGFANDETGIHAFQTGTAVTQLPVQISEVLIANCMSLPDEKGVFSDVVELHNESNTPVRLSGWYLSDRLEQRFRFRLPDITIPAGGYQLVFCDGENYISENGNIHANFALSTRDVVCLTDPAGAYITVTPQYSADDISLSRTEEGYQLMTSSLGFDNTEDGCRSAYLSRLDAQSPLVISELLTADSAVPYQGALTHAVELQNRGDVPISTAGWYLSDGKDPYACPLPERTLSAGQRLVLPISRETTGFSLSRGESLYLMSPDYLFASCICGDGMMPGCSMQLSEEGSEPTYVQAEVTLGFENTREGAIQFQSQTASGSLRLSEAMSANDSFLPGPYGNTTDWVELYNAGSSPLLLSDYCLTDSDDLYQHPLPAMTLAPGAYAVILLSESDRNLLPGYAHLSMNLSAGGDTLYLTKDGRIEDYLILPKLGGDTAWGRPAGALYAAQLSKPTPGAVNSDEARISQIPTAELPQGTYSDASSLTVSFSGSGEIFYTTDCSNPDRNARRYTGPIQITETTVFRVIAYEDGCAPSQILDLTYLVGETDTLPSMCLVTNPYYLWNYSTGIYVLGPGAETTYPCFGANFWADTECPATVSLFETDGGGFCAPCGLKIFGGFSRVQAKKSFACMFRSEFGASSLDYPLFGNDGLNSFQSFVLRAGGQDFLSSKFRDELITSLASDYLGLPVQKYRPVALYLNGEYWGIYFIREKLNDQYVAGHYCVDAEDVDFTLQAGNSSVGYRALRSYAIQHDLKEQVHYDYVCSQMDVANYMDYMITQMWIGNGDRGNVKFFKTSRTSWTWALYDTDVSMFDPANNPLPKFIGSGFLKSDDTHSIILLNCLLENSQFKDAFLRRMAYQMNTVWNETVVTARIDDFCRILEPDIEKECARWSQSVATWEESVQVLRTFAAQRNGYLLKYIQDFFGLTTQQMRDYGFEV